MRVNGLAVLLLMLASVATAQTPNAIVDGVAMPGVTGAVANAIPNAPPASSLKTKSTPDGIIHARFGETQVVTIARDRLNRIVTPFPNLKVKIPQDEATRTETDASVLYLTTTAEEPVSLYLLDESDPLKALSLVLVPKATMPADLTLRIEGYATGAGNERRDEQAERWERDQPYVTTLIRTLKVLASGRIPDGFGLRTLTHADTSTPICVMPGLSIEFAQVAEGHDLSAYIARITNTTYAPVEIRETGCAGREVVAVAAWPDVVLLPRQSSELYVAVSRRDQDEGIRPRVGGAP